MVDFDNVVITFGRIRRFDMRKSAAVLFNREGRRIVDVLRDPAQPPEDLLGSLTVRRADGSEFSLQEFPLARALGDTETVRAEEIVMGVPEMRQLLTPGPGRGLVAEDDARERFHVPGYTNLPSVDKLTPPPERPLGQQG